MENTYNLPNATENVRNPKTAYTGKIVPCEIHVKFASREFNVKLSREFHVKLVSCEIHVKFFT